MLKKAGNRKEELPCAVPLNGNDLLSVPIAVSVPPAGFTVVVVRDRFIFGDGTGCFGGHVAAAADLNLTPEIGDPAVKLTGITAEGPGFIAVKIQGAPEGAAADAGKP